MSSPFKVSASQPGNGSIHLGLLPPSTPRLKTSSYQYPLKLVSPSPSHLPDEAQTLVHTVYLLTYGGGLVAGDAIDLHVTLDATTRLVLLTQGSTKLFKSRSRDIVSKQSMNVTLAPGSALCYLPDPVQPFEESCFEQKQTYTLLPSDKNHPAGNLCVLDWVCNGRPANGENWSFLRYGSRNEVYIGLPAGKRKLLLRDNMLLNDSGVANSITSRMDSQGVIGTLILHGTLLTKLGQFFMDEFKLLPRIGGRKWDSGSDCGDEEVDAAAQMRAVRQREETSAGVLWSAAAVRDCVVVKFAAPSVEAGRSWLRVMLVEEGSVARLFATYPDAIAPSTNMISSFLFPEDIAPPSYVNVAPRRPQRPTIRVVPTPTSECLPCSPVRLSHARSPSAPALLNPTVPTHAKRPSLISLASFSSGSSTCPTTDAQPKRSGSIMRFKSLSLPKEARERERTMKREDRERKIREMELSPIVGEEFWRTGKYGASDEGKGWGYGVF
ncbi:hypothetical protein LTR95_004444 [Oleoguttula sp. CCFEE 5521]